MKTNIIVRFRFEGVHRWSACPEPEVKQPLLTDVMFLRHPHRHMFHVCAKKTVTHDDRDIEIITLKREMERWHSAHRIPVQLGEMSCEQMCKMFIKTFGLDYCEVLEDGENGAEVYANDYIEYETPYDKQEREEQKVMNKKPGEQIDLDDLLSEMT